MNVPESNGQRPQFRSIQDAFDEICTRPVEARPGLLARLDTATRLEVQRLLDALVPATGLFRRLGEQIGSLPLARSLAPGWILNRRFAVLRLVGEGGMGEVYEAEDRELGGCVALKVLSPAIATLKGGLERFREEIRLARSVNSPHVCRVHDVYRDCLPDGREIVYFAMEFLDGETLTARLQRTGVLPLPLAGRIAAQLCSGLGAAHSAGVLHRDFKSSNVMLCGADAAVRAVITDFGVSKSLLIPAAANMLDGITPGYAAPEQFAGGEETPATDVYALGVVLYEMTTGALPFPLTRAADGSMRASEVAPAAPRSLRPQLSARWERTLLRCLSREPAARYSTAADVAAALGLLAGHFDRRWFVGAAVCALAGPAAGVYWFASHRESGRVRTVAVLPPRADESVAFLAEGLMYRLGDALSRAPGLRVLGPVSSRRLDGTATGAELLISGELRRYANTLRFHIEAVQAAGGKRLWSATYELNPVELEPVTREASRALLHVLAPGRQQLAGMPQAVSNAAAFESLLLARYHMARRDAASVRAALTCLDAAIAANGAAAEAHGLRALALHHLASYEIGRWKLLSDASDEAARRALALDSRQPEAHLALGANSHFYHFDWRAAEAHVRAALSAAPWTPQPLYWLAKILYPHARFDEAMNAIARAREYEPLDPSLSLMEGTVLLYSGRVREGVERMRQVAIADPEHANTWVPLSCALEEEGRLADALQAAERAVRLTGGASFARAQLGHIQALTGRPAEALAVLADLQAAWQRQQATAGEIALLYAGWRDASNTVEWLVRGLDSRDYLLTLLRVEPQLRFVRNHPTYQWLLQRLYPEAAAAFKEE